MQSHIYDSTESPDIYFDYIYNNEKDKTQDMKVSCPVIFFIYSGSVTITHKKTKVSVAKGECVFLQANTRATFHSKSENDDSFCGIYIGFNKSFLSEFYDNYYNNQTITKEEISSAEIMKMPCTPYMQSLYISMIPYWEAKTKPEKNILDLKRKECIYCMLTSDPRFYKSLFDFMKPIKQNLFYVIYKSELN